MTVTNKQSLFPYYFMEASLVDQFSWFRFA